MQYIDFFFYMDLLRDFSGRNAFGVDDREGKKNYSPPGSEMILPPRDLHKF